jgi:hypothetical protein
VVDFAYSELDLTTTTNMNLYAYATLPTAPLVAPCVLRIFANGGAVTVNETVTPKVANNTVAFPVVITNGDWGIFSFSAYGGNATNVGLAYAYVH